MSIVTRAADPETRAPAPVLTMRELELKPGVKAEDFERFACREMASASRSMPELKMHILKGDRGARKGKYILMWEFDSIEARNRIFPREGGGSSSKYQQTWKEMLALLSKFGTYVKEAPTYTDYVTISD